MPVTNGVGTMKHLSLFPGARTTLALAAALAIRESVSGRRPIELLGMPSAPAALA